MKKQICLNKSVLDFMAEHLTPESVVLEFGAGWSTPWFAHRCGQIRSIETDRKWVSLVHKDLIKTNLDNWAITLCSTNKLQFAVDVVETLKAIPAADLVLVDCREDLRMQATRLGWEHLVPGGVLVFDDAQRPKHAESIDWLLKQGGKRPHVMPWQEGDVESAKERVALAWCKPE